jgi:hypothetical protein
MTTELLPTVKQPRDMLCTHWRSEASEQSTERKKEGKCAYNKTHDFVRDLHSTDEDACGKQTGGLTATLTTGRAESAYVSSTLAG